MRRRALLAVLATATAGCPTTTDATTTTSPAETTPAPADTTTALNPPRRPIEVRISNARADAVTVSLSLARGEQVVRSRTVTVDADASHTVPTGIDRRGDYELTVTVDGDRRTVAPFDVGAYELRQGSDLLVSLTDDDVRVLIEE
jgi:hypothetical protein